VLNLHALRIFVRVAETGSVTGAARVLNISQPAVTSQLKKLEKELGLPLFSPQGRGIQLTDAGAKLAENAGRLFSLERDIESTLDDYRNGRAGRLRLVATSLPANFLLPGWVARFKGDYPEVDVVFSTASSGQAFESLLRYESDVAFIGGGHRQHHPRLSYTPWLEDEMWFVSHAGHRLADQEVCLEELVREPFAFREPGSHARELLISLCRARGISPPAARLEINGFNELVRVVSEGYGIAFLSALEAREEVDRGRLARIRATDVQPINPIGLAHRKEPLPGPAQRLLEMMRSERPG